MGDCGKPVEDQWLPSCQGMNHTLRVMGNALTP
jgi:hypothetical protein